MSGTTRHTLLTLAAVLLAPPVVLHAAEASQPAAKPEFLVARLADYLKIRRIRAETPAVAFDKFAEPWAVIESRPDPLTSFETFIFGIERHSARLLTAEQSKRWDDLLARHTPILRRWHDERNLVRCLFERSRWDYAIADDAQAAAARRETARWADLRMAWMSEEEIAHHRFCRDAWQILSATSAARFWPANGTTR